MVVIPPAKDSDAEDVAWGLQTAEALWKRGERVDAIVWLRRAAQAAGDAADDDRALELARSAAELSDWLAAQPPGNTLPPSPLSQKQPATYDPHNAATFVPFGDEERSAPGLVRGATTVAPHGQPTVPDSGPSSMSIDVDLGGAESARSHLPAFVPAPVAPVAQRPAPPLSRPPSQPTMPTAEPYFPDIAPRSEDENRMSTPLARAVTAGPAPAMQEEDGEPSSASTSVPPAERVHAGMFNPWDDRASPAPIAPAPPPAPRFEEEDEVITSVRPQQLAQQRADALAAALGGLAQPKLGSEPPEQPPPRINTPPIRAVETPRASKPAPPRPVPGRPPPLPPRARKPAPPVPPAPPVLTKPTPTEAMVPAPPRMSPPPSRPTPPPAPRVTPPPPSPTQVMAQPERREPSAEAAAEAQAQADARAVAEATAQADAEAHAEAAASAEANAKAKTEAEAEAEAGGRAVPPAEPTNPEALADARAEAPSEPAVAAKLDLDSVEAFSDLPDDARAAFASAAKVSSLGEGEEVSGFALAYILSGTVDVAATMVDAPAARLERGAVLRSRGTMDEGVPMRLIGVGAGVVATWTDAAVTEAFRTCPWVEEDLRTAADRVQTIVGVTIGPLGERLDASIREQIIGRLTMRTLIAGEVVVTAGQPIPGILLVGVGEIELFDGDAVAGVVGSGEFVFPGEVLGHGDAPHSARAGAGGALILFGDRHIAQDLFITCPPLLEVFAGM